MAGHLRALVDPQKEEGFPPETNSTYTARTDVGWERDSQSVPR